MKEKSDLELKTNVQAKEEDEIVTKQGQKEGANL